MPAVQSTATTGASRSSNLSRLVAVMIAVIAVLAATVSPVGAWKKDSKWDAYTTSSDTTISDSSLSYSSLRTVDTSTEWKVAEPTVEALSPGSLAAVADRIGATKLREQGITGQGIHVAVIDTGVAPVPALTGPGTVAAVVDFSFEANNPELVYRDGYGHGTHMAGIIAGNDPATGFQGIAPGAGIVSVKVGASNGAVDVSQVIAAIDWVIEHRNSHGLNIRVLSLSYGTDGTQDYRIDPLTHAVERAWDAGIVVVVSAGNEGKEGLSNPARDPFVIAVGAADESGTSKVESADFTSSGNAERYPDVLAPGVSIESLRAPASWADVHHPTAVVDDELMRGTGSSQSAAVVSGAAALLLEARPELTPDQVKYLLQSTATYATGSWKKSGYGMINVAAAAAARNPGDRAAQTFPRSTGEGTLEGARGTHHVVLDGVVLEGEVTFLGGTWDGASWGGASWGGASWGGASWGGASWGGASWGGASWGGASWGGASWGGASWGGASWGGASWGGASWGGASWG